MRTEIQLTRHGGGLVVPDKRGEWCLDECRLLTDHEHFVVFDRTAEEAALAAVEVNRLAEIAKGPHQFLNTDMVYQRFA